MECAESVKAFMHRQAQDSSATEYRHVDTNARSVDHLSHCPSDGHDNGASHGVHCEQEHSW